MRPLLQQAVSRLHVTLEGFGGIGYLLLVYVQSISVIMAVFPTVPAMLSSGRELGAANINR